LYLHFQFLTLNNFFFVCFPFSMANDVLLLIHHLLEFALKQILSLKVLLLRR
jgi:hypothetical protein